MSDERFDLIFEGLIAPGADPAEARSRLSAIFKLNDQGADRLFSGKPLVVKRDVDSATAEQFETVFARAGAILTIVAKGGAAPISADDAPNGEVPSARSEPRENDALAKIDTSHLSLAPQGGLLEEPYDPPLRPIDIGYLSLVATEGWTLEDCQPPPTPVLLPDLSGLALVPIPVEPESESTEID